jgi:HprK-related kinase B
MSCAGAAMTSPSPAHLLEKMLNLTEGFAQARILLLRFGDCRIEVRSNSPLLVEKLRRYYADFLVDKGAPEMVVTAMETTTPALEAKWVVKPPDPGKTKIKEEYLDIDGGRLVRKRLTGMIFYFDRQRHLACGPCTTNDNQIVNFINSRFIQWAMDRGYLLCHAAGVSSRGKGLALAGFSGMGKSTLALHMMSRGLDFVSNDRLLIRPSASGPSASGVDMYGVAKLPRVNPGTILGNSSLAGILDDHQKESYAKLSPKELWSLESKHDVYLDECFGTGKFLIASKMSGLVILNWKHKDQRPALELVDIRQRLDLMETVIKSPGLFFLPAPSVDYDFSQAAYLKLLQDCPIFEARGVVDFAQASEACIHFLNQR